MLHHLLWDGKMGKMKKKKKEMIKDYDIGYLRMIDWQSFHQSLNPVIQQAPRTPLVDG